MDWIATDRSALRRARPLLTMIDEQSTTMTMTGILEWTRRAEGRVRQLADTLIENPDDPFVPLALAETYPLRHGQEVTVEVVTRRSRNRPRGGGPRHERAVVEQVLSIEGLPPSQYAANKPFEELTVIDPQPRLSLEYPGCPPSCRLIDLF
jgi:transcription termination factor Rho